MHLFLLTWQISKATFTALKKSLNFKGVSSYLVTGFLLVYNSYQEHWQSKLLNFLYSAYISSTKLYICVLIYNIYIYKIYNFINKNSVPHDSLEFYLTTLLLWGPCLSFFNNYIDLPCSFPVGDPAIFFNFPLYILYILLLPPDSHAPTLSMVPLYTPLLVDIITTCCPSDFQNNTDYWHSTWMHHRTWELASIPEDT